jgi:hypothetical protein
MNALDPVIIGCLYENKETGKFFLKVRKIFYLIQHLLNFAGDQHASFFSQLNNL